MLRVGFEPKIPVIERAKTVHALDRAANVIGKFIFTFSINIHKYSLIEEQYLLGREVM
jgi:hypothetical protein